LVATEKKQTAAISRSREYPQSKQASRTTTRITPLKMGWLAGKLFAKEALATGTPFRCRA
jgi:hypothetical protein